MKKHTQIFITILLLIIGSTKAQTYKIIDVETSKFPIIKANILAYDINYNPDSLTNEMISIYENGIKITPIEYKAPKSSVLPTSIVLVLDVSASMVGIRFDVLKETAKNFIKYLPLEVSEVAIASFSDQISLNCDFTHDINRLNQSINRLNTEGGTNFDRAFLTPFSGAINIARQGQHKRVIIFLTDGLSEVKPYEVANRAIHDSIIINCLTIGLPISNELKTIAYETGGKHYSNLNYKSEIKTAFEKIYSDVQVNTYGKISWRSFYSCKPKKTTTINLGRSVHKILFTIPDTLLGTVEITPTTIEFDKGYPGTLQYKPVFIKGDNIGLNILSIDNSNNKLFSFKAERLPIKTTANETKILNLSFTPKDSIYAIASYTIKNSGCPDAVIEASSGGVKKLVITNPIEDDDFVRGDTISIKWNGISKSTSVEFLYQIEGEKNWFKIGSGIQHNKSWIAPAMNNKIRIQGQVTNNVSLSNLMTSTTALIDGSEFKSAYFNENGTEILTLSTNGSLKNWNSKTGLLNHKFENKVFGNYAFFPGHNRVVNILDTVIEVFTNRNGLSMITMPIKSDKNLSSFTHNNDNELYITLVRYKGLGHMPSGKYIDKTSSPNVDFVIRRTESKLKIQKKSTQKNWFSISLTDDFIKSVLHRTKPYLIVENKHSTTLYNLETKNIIREFPKEIFVKYSASEDFVLTNNGNKISINSLETGKPFTSFPEKSEYVLSANGKYFAFIKNDTVIIESITKNRELWKQRFINPEKLQFFPTSKRLLFLVKDSLCIFDFNKMEIETKVFAEPGLIKIMDIAPNEKTILITTPNIVAVWEIKSHFDADTTPYFNLAVPEPFVKPHIMFNNQYVNSSTEKIFPSIIQNKSGHSIIVDSVFIESDNSIFQLVSKNTVQTIEPGKSADIELRFTPKTTGNISGKFIVVSGLKQYTCTVIGKGIKSDYKLLSPIIQFPVLAVSSTCDTLIPLLTNIGTEPISVNKVDIVLTQLDNFSKTKLSLPIVLKPNDTIWSEIRFKPTTRGRQTAFIRLNLEDNKWIKATDLYGVGKAKRELVIAGETVDFITKKGLSSTVTITSLQSGKIAHKLPTNSNGEFAIKVNTDLNYSITAERVGFFSSSENIDLTAPQTEDTIWTTITLTSIQQNSTVRLNNIFFESGKADLLDISKTELLRIITLLRKNSKLKIEIHGHTDNVGNSNSNKILSEKRANSVKNFIINNKINPQRINIKSFGESKPVMSNSTNTGRKANRRVEIKFIEY